MPAKKAGPSKKGAKIEKPALKDRIESIKEEFGAAERQKELARRKAIREQVKQDHAKAQLILLNLPELVRQALSNDYRSVELYRGGDVASSLEETSTGSGVARFLLDGLQEEGLLERVWIDARVVGSGRLMFTI